SIEERESLRKQALKHRDYPQFYLSKDSKYGGIWIRTDFGVEPIDNEEGKKSEIVDEKSESEKAPVGNETSRKTKFKLTTMPEYAEFNRAVEKIIQRPEHTDFLTFYSVGNPAIMGFFNDVINSEIEILLSVALLLITVVLLFLFRSVSGFLWPLCIVVFASVLTVGLAGWFDVTMSMMFSILLMLILVVGVADSVHIMSGYVYFRTQKLKHEAAIRAVLRRSGLACLLTSVTTAIGMFAMVFVPIKPIKYFGILAGIGVLLAFVLTIVLLPLMLDILRPISKKRAKRIAASIEKTSLVQKILLKIEPYTYSYPKRVTIIFMVVLGIASYGVSKVQVDSNMVEILKKGLPVRTAYDLVDRVMGGTQSMEIFLDFQQQDALKDPDVLNAMEKIQKILETQHVAYVVKTSSLVNVVKDSYRSLNEGREEMYLIPQEQRMLEQTLLMFDSANPEDRLLLVPDDYSQGRISVRLLNYGSIKYIDFFEEIQKQINETFDPLKSKYPKMKVQIIGSLALMMTMVEHISWSQIQSFGLALITITIVLFFVFGSPKIGLIAMIPNIFPVMVTFGTMGLFGFALDADTLIIAPIVIGIAVDDTIHFLTHYRSEYIESGDSIKSIILALREAGQAIIFSTVILVIGFLALIISVHQGMANFGVLSAVAFCSALLADLFLLPSLCVLFNVTFEKQVEPVIA
ncbi:MMPL family transporter, partial [bacterium]|nr:MMPL family transporter [bacterium]